MIRKLRADEIKLISYLVRDTIEGTAIIKQLGILKVKEMNDGGMGSLQVVVDGVDNRKSSGVLSDWEYHDIDGMLVIISVILDNDDNFYELDIFKGDFSPLIRFPNVPES